MNSTIVYNLRNRSVYSTVFESFLEGIISFLENYKEFLTKEHSLLLLYLNSATYIKGENIKAIFRALLNYVEIYFEQSPVTGTTKIVSRFVLKIKITMCQSYTETYPLQNFH